MKEDEIGTTHSTSVLYGPAAQLSNKKSDEAMPLRSATTLAYKAIHCATDQPLGLDFTKLLTFEVTGQYIIEKM